MYIEKLHDVSYIRSLDINQLEHLCQEIRDAIIYRYENFGGHLSSNLGVVELTVALHYVFNSPIDKIIFDISHQCYTHKILTGRARAFYDEECFDEVNGFLNPLESEHDLFSIGHSSTSLSLACGLMKARDNQHQKHNIIAVVGDGALCGGQAYEGLGGIRQINSNCIIVVNDNEMAIAENHGGCSNNLCELRTSKGKSSNNFFKSMGFKYAYVEEGNNLQTLINVLSEMKDTTQPVVIHVHTCKGKGLEYSENNKEETHFVSPLTKTHASSRAMMKNYFEMTFNHLEQKIKQDGSIFIITCATPSTLALNASRRKSLEENYIDVGICEEHAVSFVAGLSRGGAKPVLAIYSTFLQRAYDQIQQDLCIDGQGGTILVCGASVFGYGGATHNGLYDISQLGNIPNLVYLAPTSVEEYLGMLDWSIQETHIPVAIRVPATSGASSKKFDPQDFDYKKWIIEENGSGVAIVAISDMFSLAKSVCENLKKYNIFPTLVNPVCVSKVDEECLNKIAKNHKLVVTIEEGIIEGGYGQKIASYLGDSNILVKNFGLKKSTFGDFNPQQLLEENELTECHIAKYIKQVLLLCKKDFI